MTPAARCPSSLGCTVCCPETHDTQNSRFLGLGTYNTQSVRVVLHRTIREQVLASRRQLVFEPEASSLSVVVIIDVGDDFSEADGGGSRRGFAASSGHTEGHFLSGTSDPALTTKFRLVHHQCFREDLLLVIQLLLTTGKVILTSLTTVFHQ